MGFAEQGQEVDLIAGASLPFTAGRGKAPMSTEVGVDPYNRVSDQDDVCAGKHGGVATSRAAFRRARHGIIKSQQAILELARVSPNGITCKEAAAALGKDMSSISPRFTELAIEQNLLRRLKDRRDGCYVHVLEIPATPEPSTPEEAILSALEMSKKGWK